MAEPTANSLDIVFPSRCIRRGPRKCDTQKTWTLMALWPAGVFSLPHKNPIHFSRARIRHGYLNWKMGVQLFLSTPLFLPSSHKIMQSEKRREESFFCHYWVWESPFFFFSSRAWKEKQDKTNKTKSLIWNARQKESGLQKRASENLLCVTDAMKNSPHLPLGY